MDGAAAVIATGFSLFRNSVSWRGSDRKTDSLSDNKRRREKRGEREVARERERKRGRERQRWMKAIDSQCVRRRAMRKNLIPRLSSAVITISHCWREIWLISFSALEQVSSFLLSNFPQCSITVPRRGQREREREREREKFKGLKDGWERLRSAWEPLHSRRNKCEHRKQKKLPSARWGDKVRECRSRLARMRRRAWRIPNEGGSQGRRYKTSGGRDKKREWGRDSREKAVG